MRSCLLALLYALPLGASASVHVVIVQGLAGSPEYQQRFDAELDRLRIAAERLAGSQRVRLFGGDQATRESILAHFETLDASDDDRVAVFLLGHGSYDGFQYKFNLPGPDLTDQDLAEALDALPIRHQLLVNTSSASGALLEELKADARILITATRSGGERNATRFGTHFVAALDDPAADVNKDGGISAREAFDYAQRHVSDWFEYEGRLATEHPQLVGEHADRFAVARLQSAADPVDDQRFEELRRRRDELDEQINALGIRRSELGTEAYLEQLEQLMLDLAMVEERIEQLREAGGER